MKRYFYEAELRELLGMGCGACLMDISRLDADTDESERIAVLKLDWDTVIDGMQATLSEVRHELLGGMSEFTMLGKIITAMGDAAEAWTQKGHEVEFPWDALRDFDHEDEPHMPLRFHDH